MYQNYLIVACALLSAVLSSHSMADASDGVEFYEKRIRPLLENHCVECHGSGEQQNDLRLDSGGAIVAGGSAGPAIVPGKPNASLLIAAVRHVDENLKMPPDGKLQDIQIADLVRWIEMGAPYPGSGDREVLPAEAIDSQKSDLWAFQQPARSAPPQVVRGDWPRTAIDRFILATLEANELLPAAPADKQTLLRRATFDLTGLPPTSDEIQAFLTDDSPNAFARVVDRLLSSPQYGERWGRHWLDVARYADSNGLDENVAHGNAWRYRDYVIDAFNNDEPYNQFVREQIAGDLLPYSNVAEFNKRLIATGYLVLGPKVLAEVDKQKMEMDIIDEQIDTLGKSLLGLTIGCARCHDHKFDPISTKDYYALAGIFKSTRTMESLATIARWHENNLEDPAYDDAKSKHDALLAAHKRELEALMAAATATLQTELGESAVLPEMPEKSFPKETRDRLKELRDTLATLEKTPPVAPSAMGVRDSTVSDVAIHLRGSHLTLGETAPRGFPEALCDTHPPVLTSQSSGRLELANWLTDPSHPLTARVIVNRVWRWHFGRGLVATPDNFGRLGEPPSHPELLDWLAVELTTNGWSLKHLHRMIMLSATYQMRSDVVDSRAVLLDPQNRWFWRANMRRLEAEELRDAMLAVSGQLDNSMGGSLLQTANRTHIFDHTSKDSTEYVSRRRSIYLPVVRNHLADSFTLFDYADASVPSGDRPTSTVASQALYFLNSVFAVMCADQLAKQPFLTKQKSDRDRIRHAFELVFARPATDKEIELALTFLSRTQQQEGNRLDSTTRERWRLLCHALLMSNEFVYLK
jgi:hypothetical protein